MLESNTDRMYFTIGAVIVAALIIGLAVWLFNSDSVLATKLAETINGMFTQASNSIGDINSGNTHGGGK